MKMEPANLCATILSSILIGTMGDQFVKKHRRMHSIVILDDVAVARVTTRLPAIIEEDEIELAELSPPRQQQITHSPPPKQIIPHKLASSPPPPPMQLPTRRIFRAVLNSGPKTVGFLYGFLTEVMWVGISIKSIQHTYEMYIRIISDWRNGGNDSTSCSCHKQKC